MDASPAVPLRFQADSMLQGGDELDASPSLSWGGPLFPDPFAEMNHMHVAALQADVAAKHAASLTRWVQHLFGQVNLLQQKVADLDNWKRTAVEDMSKMRSEHKLLKKKLGADFDDTPSSTLPQKTKSMPHLSPEFVEPLDLSVPLKTKKAKASLSSVPVAPMGPPPGLGGFQAAAQAQAQAQAQAKSVRFANGSSTTTSAAGEPSPGVADVVAAAAVPLALEGADQLSADGGAEDPLPAVSPTPSDSESGPFRRSCSVISTASHMTDAPDEGLAEGVHILPGYIEGAEAECALWRISNLSQKLRGCMGRALVSSPFSMLGLEDLRLMIFPDGKEPPKGPRSRRQKELYVRMVSEGPLEGCLKLKVPECPAPHVLDYYLKIGSCRKGPFQHDFSESTVHGCLDFGVDWLTQVEGDQSLTVTLEVLRVGGVGVAPESESPAA